MSEELPGYRIELHTSISTPVTIGGLPRMVAVGIGTVTVLLSLALQQPWLGIPLGVVLWVGAYALSRTDPYFFRALDRHIRQKPHLDA